MDTAIDPVGASTLCSEAKRPVLLPSPLPTSCFKINQDLSKGKDPRACRCTESLRWAGGAECRLADAAVWCTPGSATDPVDIRFAGHH